MTMAITGPPPLLHAISDTAQQLGIGRTVVYKLVNQGELHLVHIGRRALVTHASLVAYVDRIIAEQS